MRVEDLNVLNPERLHAELSKCCGSSNWVKKMIKQRPFKNEDSLFKSAESTWLACTSSDWLEAFSHHPRIGENKDMEKKFAGTSKWAANEQKGVETATAETLKKLVELNRQYEKRFGYIFIVCATGKTAAEMVALLEARIHNSMEDEIKIAMAEQNKITLLRLKKLLS